MVTRSQDTNYNKNNFAELAARKRATGRWMKFGDMVQMSEELKRSYKRNSNFEVRTLEDIGILFINKKTNEKFILLEPRMIGAGYEKNLKNTIENLKEQGFGGKITFIAPANKNNVHWVMGCGVLNLDNGKVESETKIDSFADGRQTDGFSCGVHTMEAAAELMNTSLPNYMKLYKSRADIKNGVNQTTTSSVPVKSEEEKNAELLRKLDITEDDWSVLRSNNIGISSIKEMYALTEGLKSELERVNKTRELLGLGARGQQSKGVAEEDFVEPTLPRSTSQIDMRFVTRPTANATKTSLQGITKKEERENVELNTTENEISSIKEMRASTEGLKSDRERIEETGESLNLNVKEDEPKRVSPIAQVQQKSESVVEAPESVEKPVEVSKNELIKKREAMTIEQYQILLAALFIICYQILRDIELHDIKKRPTARNDRGISI